MIILPNPSILYQTMKIRNRLMLLLTELPLFENDFQMSWPFPPPPLYSYLCLRHLPLHPLKKKNWSRNCGVLIEAETQTKVLATPRATRVTRRLVGLGSKQILPALLFKYLTMLMIHDSRVDVAESKPEKAAEAFELSETAVEISPNDLVVSVPTSTTTYTSASSDGGSSCESLSEPESDEGDEALGWTPPESGGGRAEEKEKITLTFASTLISSPVRNTTVWKPSSAFISNFAFTPASVVIKPRSPPVIITGRWAREHRGSRKEWTWVAEDSTAEPQGGIEIDEDEEEVEENMVVKTEEEEDAIRAEIFRADMARVGGRGWNWERGVLVEKAVTTTAATAPEFAEVGTGDSPLVEDGSSSNSPTESGLIIMPTERRTVPVWPLLLVFVAITLLAWISRVERSLADNVLWGGIWMVPGTLAWESIAPLETVLFKIGWQLLPVGAGTAALALLLSAVFADICAVVRGRAAMRRSSSLFGWTTGIVGGAGAVTRGVMRWRGAFAMTTTEGRVVFTPPEIVTGMGWEGAEEVSRYEESLPTEFVPAGDIAPAVYMCPRYELGIGAGTGELGGGAGSSFGLGLFLLGFLVWGSGGRQLRRSAGASPHFI